MVVVAMAVSVLARPIRDPLWFQLILNLLVVALVLVAQCYLNRRPAAELGLTTRRGWLWQLVAGMVLGVLAVSALVAALAAGGWLVRLTLQWTTRQAESLAPHLAPGLLGMLGVAVCEELLFRGYMLERFRRLGLPVALLLSAAIFSLLHFLNQAHDQTLLGPLNIALAGVLFGLARLATGSLWLPVGFHWTWNWSIIFLYGLPMYRGAPSNSLFTAEVAGPWWITGGAYGPEGSLLATAVLALLIAHYWRQSRQRQLTYWDGVWK